MIKLTPEQYHQAVHDKCIEVDGRWYYHRYYTGDKHSTHHTGNLICEISYPEFSQVRVYQGKPEDPVVHWGWKCHNSLYLQYYVSKL